MFKFFYIIICVVLVPTLVYGQKSKGVIPDSLINRSYLELKSMFYDVIDDSEKAIVIGEAYKKIAKADRDSSQIARAFGLLARVHDTKKNIQLCDSIIKYTKGGDDPYYPAVGYSLKGYYYYYQGNYQDALNNYLLAYEAAKAKGNEKQRIDITQFIAALKNRWGDYEGAGDLYQEHLDYLRVNGDKNYLRSEDYLRTLYNLTLSYQHRNKLDSAEIFLDEGIIGSLLREDSLYFNDFKHTRAVNFYLKGNLNEAETLFVALRSKKLDSFKLSLSNFYLGSIEAERGNVLSSIAYFKMVDNLYSEKNEVFPELRITYENLVGHYRKLNNPEKELEYIRKILSVDSLLALNREYINRTINKKYEVPELVSQKEQLIAFLNRRNKNQSYLNIGLSIGIFLLILSTIYFYQRNRLNKKRFLEFRLTRDKDNTKATPPNKYVIKTEIESILRDKLKIFEKEYQFTDEDITLFNLAKSLGTNSTYLSRVINSIKDKNFSNYINDLRIDLIIKRLDEESLLRKYTIQALGEEVGFKKGEAFSKAFYKHTEMKPSFYLKQLRAQHNN